MDSQKNIIKQQKKQNQEKVILNCSKHGDYESLKTSVKGRKRTFEYFTSCQFCEDEKHQEIKSEYDFKKKISFELGMKKIGIPPKYLKYDIKNLTPKNEKQGEYIEQCRDYVSNFHELCKIGSSIIFTGSPGTGKTMISLSMVKELVKVMYKIHFDKYHPIENFKAEDYRKAVDINPCKYVNVYDYFSEIRETYSKNSKITEKNVYQKYLNTGLLIFDEVGVQGGTDFENQALFRIINMRYEQDKPTFLISNLNEADLNKYIGERSVDRFHENYGSVFIFDWESHRRE